MDSVDRPRRSLEELVDQLFAAMGFRDEEPGTATQTASTDTTEPSAARSIHEARRLRQAGDVDTALAVIGGMNTAKSAPGEARWAFSEWKQLVKRRFGAPAPAGLQPGCRKGCRAGAPRRRDAGGRGGPGDALGAGQGRLGAQPPGPAAPGRRCVMVTANVDHPDV